MDLYDWILALHVLGAFLLAGSLALYWALVLAQLKDPRAGRIATLSHVSRPADIAVVAGSLLTVVFGIWLAIDHPSYEIWDGWVLAALILWAAGTEAGRRSGAEFVAVRDRVRAMPPETIVDYRSETRRGLMLHAIATALVILLLADMIWKPGA